VNPVATGSGTLYLVATPIGNLSDLSARASETLSRVDLIACEDTRITRRLLAKLSLQIPLLSYREENEKTLSIELADQIEEGKTIALVSDAGCPNLSDPGFRLVRECHLREIKVVPVPGPNAALTALIASGLPTHQFLYLGFLPKKSGAVRKTLEKWRDFEGSLIFYESKYKFEKTLKLIQETLGGDRFVCMAREITKAHETIRTTKVSQLIDFFQTSSGKGEFTLVIAPEGYSLSSA
jgi:16S rRNA (cytidine1402-2'-O)-methyltransferase